MQALQTTPSAANTNISATTTPSGIKGSYLMGNQTYQNSPCPSATMAGRVCSHHGRLRRMPRANPTTVAAVVKHIHYTGVKNSRERHRKKEGPLSLRKNCALTVLRTLNTQRTPVLVPSDAELKDVAPSTTPFFTQHSFTSVHPKKRALSTQPQQSAPQLAPLPVPLPGPRIQVPSSCKSYHCA